MKSHRFFVFSLLLIGLSSTPARAGTVPGEWTIVPIFGQEPLEVKLGTYTTGLNPDALVVVLWNDGAQNRLDAVRVPPPYDGTGVSSVGLDSGATLFALGDICTGSGGVVVPYIKDFNIEVARYNGATWTTETIPDTLTNNFTTADCGRTSNGLFITGHDFTDSEIEVFQTSANRGPGGYTFYGRYGPSISGPFDGGVRDALATTQAPTSDAMSLHQLDSGRVRVTHFNTSQNPPQFTHTNIVDLPAPPGTFTVVREAAAGSNAEIFYFTYNADDNARTVEVPIANPAGFTADNLGPISNMGSQFTFQGGGLVHIDGGAPGTNVLWGDYFYIDKIGNSATDPNFPNAGVGGPIDGCTLSNGPDVLHTIYAAPRVGSDGTDLIFRREVPLAIHEDGFESDAMRIFGCN